MLVQGLEVTICYNAVTGDPMKVHSPTNGDDITALLMNLPALPSLRTARITATRRSVGPVDMCCVAHLDHLAIACAELDLVCAEDWDPSKAPASVHVISEKGTLETVGLGKCAHPW